MLQRPAGPARPPSNLLLSPLLWLRCLHGAAPRPAPLNDCGYGRALGKFTGGAPGSISASGPEADAAHARFVGRVERRGVCRAAMAATSRRKRKLLETQKEGRNKTPIVIYPSGNPGLT